MNWNAKVQSKRIAKVISAAIQIDKEIRAYETLTSDLLEWIRLTIEQLSDRQFANSLHGVRQQLYAFNQYRINEKAEKFAEKGNLEVLLFTIQSRIRAQNQKPYLPREGRLIADINRAWTELEKAEHGRELALREELVRQENLEQLAAKFNKKASMREKWLNDSQKLVISDQFGFDLESVEAAFKKQEAIQTDIGISLLLLFFSLENVPVCSNHIKKNKSFWTNLKNELKKMRKMKCFE